MCAYILSILFEWLIYIYNLDIYYVYYIVYAVCYVHMHT